MNLTKHLVFAVFVSVTVALGQTATETFERFAVKQDSLFIAAYEKRDTKAYDKLLTEFLLRYRTLPVADRKEFTRYLTGAYYNFCCTYAIMGNKEMALTYFRKAIDAGYVDYAHLKADSDLDNIRNEKAFKDLSESMRPVGDFLFILQRAGTYNVADNRQLPAFAYQSADNPNLTALRHSFNLDSIAGEGSDVFKIINLLHWIHRLIPHDGNHENPVVRNAMSLIAECKRDNRGLNCRGLATVLNECYLALGLKSRIVTCRPKDSLNIDRDCHVIDLVYSGSLKKWLWIDPTNDAYVMDEKGELLSIEEVRERIIADKPLLLNPDANWNRKAITKEYYLNYYMAKNLYMLECPARSEYNMETREQGKRLSYIKLLPLEYFAQTPDKTEARDDSADITVTTYRTNNPALFWTAP